MDDFIYLLILLLSTFEGTVTDSKLMLVCRCYMPVYHSVNKIYKNNYVSSIMKFCAKINHEGPSSGIFASIVLIISIIQNKTEISVKNYDECIC